MRRIHKLSMAAMRGTAIIAPIAFRRVMDVNHCPEDDALELLAAGGARHVGEFEIGDDAAAAELDALALRRGGGDAEPAGTTLFVDELTGWAYVRRDFGGGIVTMRTCCNVLDLYGEELRPALDTQMYAASLQGVAGVKVARSALGCDIRVACELYRKAEFAITKPEAVRMAVYAIAAAADVAQGIEDGRLHDRLTRTGVKSFVRSLRLTSLAEPLAA